MYSTYDRNFLSDFFVFYAEKINPALCVGRRENPDSLDVRFALAFILHLNNNEIERINSLVGKGEEEILIEFFKEEPDKRPRAMTKKEKESFDFSNMKWEVKRFATGFDELREVPQNLIVVTFR